MNFIEFESAQKLRGVYYTPPDVAAFLNRWALETKPRRILEPACGDGIFFESLAALKAASIETLVCCEIDPVEAGKAGARAGRLRGVTVEIYAEDFLEWHLSRLMRPPEFDAVIGNPPFIRYQYLDAKQQALAEQIFARYDLRFTKHTNAWVPFVVASLAMLRSGGRLAMVVPAELLHVLHAKPLRDFILAQCSRVLVIDPEHIWFNDTLQGVVLLLAEKRGEEERDVTSLAIRPLADRRQLARPAGELFSAADFFPATILNGKWMVGLLGSNERSLLSQLEDSPQVSRLGEIAAVDVGIVTGANKFFLVPDRVVNEYGLQRWAYPMFGRSDHVRGVIYDKECHQENKRLGLPANFLWFGSTPLRQLPDGARRYIRAGEAEGLVKRYKCRIRSPWYNVPSVYVTPIGMLKRSHHFPRLILNTAKAYTTDTAYRMMVKRGKASDLVVSFVNSLTALSSELEGRHYGGGVLELVPSEIEKLLVPTGAGPYPLDVLKDLDQAIRAGVPAEELLPRQDELLLKPLGIGSTDRKVIFDAWDRLRGRRQRTSSEPPEENTD